MTEEIPDLPVQRDQLPFTDRPAALTVLRRMSACYGEGFVRLLPRLLTSLAAAADPDRCLVYFERFAENYGPELFPDLEKNPRVIEILSTLFSVSRFLTEIVLRSPDSLTLLTNRQALTERKTIDRITAEAEAAMQAARTYPEKVDALRRYQRGELLRIGASDFLGLYDLRSVLSQLSRMAIGLVRAGLSLAVKTTGISPQGFTVLAMGKLGGYELNYSSDIDLIFVSADNETDYPPLAKRLIEIIASPTAEGFLYRVDLRLRPWGKDGPLVTSLPAYVHYVDKNARLWEKQALLKVRSIAGDQPLGEELRRQIEPRIHCVPADQVRAGIFAMKQRTEEYLKQKGRDWGEVKLGVGSIRDIEFVVQSLQMTHAHIRTRATLKAIPRLRAEGLLTPAEARVLTEGYVFLRTIEHYLQMLDYRQTYTLPSDPLAIALLARRLGFEGPQAGENFIARYEGACTAIRSIYMQLVGNNDMKTPNPINPEFNRPDVPSHVARMDPSYALTFSAQEIQQHALMAENLDGEHLVEVDILPLEAGRFRMTVVAYDYAGELSLICGLIFAYRLNILSGEVFTYEPVPTASEGKKPADPQKRKIVDVFTVQAMNGEQPVQIRLRYQDELAALLRLVQAGQQSEARGELAKRVALTLTETPRTSTALYPIDIEIDNDSSARYTVLRIEGLDTAGFLYELTNALSSRQIYIARVLVDSVGKRVHDSLHVTDSEGRKIIAPEKQRELRTAVVLVKHFTHLLPHSPNPESALLHFREFIDQFFQRPNWSDELASLDRTEVLDALARLLGISDFLWDDFLRMQYASLFPVVSNLDALRTAKTRDQLQAELEAALLPVHHGPQAPSDDAPWQAVLNTFKDREMFRIDMRNILGHTVEFDQFSRELTDLAEVVVNSAYHLSHEDLRTLYGPPRLENGQISQMVVCALGKFGGDEMGFASDIELMFIYSGDGQTGGPQVIPSAEFYEKVVQSFVGAIRAKREGIFEVDLQLRPYGKSSNLAVSLGAFRRYFGVDGAAWPYERQALVKLRPVAGDPDLGRLVANLRDEFVYNGSPFDTAAMRAMRERQIRQLVTGGTFNAKYSPGGLLDVEYLVQGLQINFGTRDPGLRSTNTRQAMTALAERGCLSADDFAKLRKAHTFLRWLIDSLRVVRGNARDMTVPPVESEEFAFLARRLRYGKDTSRLYNELTRYTSDVQELNAKLLG